MPLGLCIAICGTLCLLATTPRASLRRSSQRLWRTIVRAYPGIRVRYCGEPRAEESPAILVSNHASALDIPILLADRARPALVAKDWVLEAPIMGPGARAIGTLHRDQVLDLERADRMLVFPEGRRSPDGQVRRFHLGGFVLARRLGLPVRPLAISGSHGVHPADRWLQNPGIILIHHLPEMPPLAGESDRAWSRRCRRLIAEAVRRDSLQLLSHPLQRRQRSLQRAQLPAPVRARWRAREDQLLQPLLLAELRSWQGTHTLSIIGPTDEAEAADPADILQQLLQPLWPGGCRREQAFPASDSRRAGVLAVTPQRPRSCTHPCLWWDGRRWQQVPDPTLPIRSADDHPRPA